MAIKVRFFKRAAFNFYTDNGLSQNSKIIFTQLLKLQIIKQNYSKAFMHEQDCLAYHNCELFQSIEMG